MHLRLLAHARRLTIVTVTTLLALTVLLLPLPLPSPAPQTRLITIYARSFAFEPGTVRVNRGDTVAIELESLDAVHGLFIDGYGVNLEAEPGRAAKATFVASRQGTYKMRCSVSCGALHPFMIGELVVGPHTAFPRAAAATLIVVVGALAFFHPRRSDVERVG